MTSTLEYEYDYVNAILHIHEEPILDDILKIKDKIEKDPKYIEEFNRIKYGESNRIKITRNAETVEIYRASEYITLGLEQHTLHYIEIKWTHTIYNKQTTYMIAGVQPNYAIGNVEYAITVPDIGNVCVLNRVILYQSPYTQQLGMCKNALLSILYKSDHPQFEQVNHGTHELYSEIYNNRDSWWDLSFIVFDGEFKPENEALRVWSFCTYLTREFFEDRRSANASQWLSKALAKRGFVSLRTLDSKYSDVLSRDREDSVIAPEAMSACLAHYGCFGTDPLDLFGSYHAKSHSSITVNTQFSFALTYLTYIDRYKSNLFVRTIGPSCLQLLLSCDYKSLMKRCKHVIEAFEKSEARKSAERAAVRRATAIQCSKCDLEFD